MFVLDASTALSWLFPDESNEGSERNLELLRVEGALVPSVWPLEVCNALLVAERRKRLTETDTHRLVSILTQLPITVEESASLNLVTSTLALGRHHGLSAYDTAYLELAVRAGLPLASADATLVRAARNAGVRILE